MYYDNSNLKSILKCASLANQKNEILVCSFSADLDKLKGSNAKILKTTFLNGPSKSIISNGTVKTYTLYNNDSGNSENDLENDSDNDLEFDSDGSENNSDNSENDSAQNNENYHYTMLESFIELNKIYSFNSEIKIFNEESEDTHQYDAQSDDTQSDNTQSEENKESDDTPREETQQENTQFEENEDKFQFGYILAVDLILKNEGMTRWVVAIDSRTESDITSIINALNSKKFKAAFNIAGKGLNSDGLVPLAVYTFINKKEYYAPFMGNCRYAIAQG